MSRDHGPAVSQRSLQAALEINVTMIGFLFLAAALLANQNWWDRHFLPLFFLSHEKYLLSERLARLAMAVLGLGIIFAVRPLLGRLARRVPARDFAAGFLRIMLAMALAFAVMEWSMSNKFVHAAAEMQPGEEPMRQPDAKLGWVFTPSHDGVVLAGERWIGYSTDGLGYRMPSRDAAVDVNQPSIIFTGESIIAGYGLNWQETIPVQVAMATDIQSANIAVFGYANDQAYLRLASELPRFRQPVAVVSLFNPSLFARNLGDDRPHLDARMQWIPATHRLWLTSLLRFLVPYHSSAEIEQGILATRAQLLATAGLAHKRGAIALVVDPQFNPETPTERMLRRRILDESGVEYVRVMLDPSWHLKGDLHPDPRAAYVIAMAIASRLKADLARKNDAVGLYGGNAN
jgi:hypothetical protein